jgi:hypothetical protein
MTAFRTCHDCGSRRGETPFPTAKKPVRKVDLCTDCATDRMLRAVARDQVDQRRAEIEAERVARTYRVPKPVWTTPLFRELRP